MSASLPASLTTVFVYGTLMPGERNAHVAQTGGAFTAQRATLRGFQLLHLRPEEYPAVIRGAATDAVHGYALSYSPDSWAAALPWLDELEGLHESPPLYTREEIVLEGESGGPLRGWIYLYARAERLGQTGTVPVPSGDWRDVLGRAGQGSDQR